MEFQIENIQTLHSTTPYNEEDLVHQNFATKLGLIHGHHRKGKIQWSFISLNNWFKKKNNRNEESLHKYKVLSTTLDLPVNHKFELFKVISYGLLHKIVK